MQCTIVAGIMLAASFASIGAANDLDHKMHFDRVWDREHPSRYNDEIETGSVSPRCRSVTVMHYDETGKLQSRSGQTCRELRSGSNGDQH